MANLISDLKIKIREFISRLLVRLKRVKRAPLDINEISDLVSQQLPEVFEMATPGGAGELSILGVTLSIAHSSNNQTIDCIHAELLCNFCVKVKESIIYNTHLMLVVEVQPNYCKETKTIGIVEPKITQLQLISDKYSIIKDTTTLIDGLLPKTFNTLLSVALTTSKALLNTKTVNKVTKYLSLYTSGSKQMVIDYHRKDIENRVIELTKDNALSYPLNESIFEEKLFADFGEKIIIEDKQLFFVFAQ